MNYFLTGLPKAGKTTLLKKVVEKLQRPAGGFFTEEIKENDIRVGFMIATLSGIKGVLSHKNSKSRCRVGKYGVEVSTLDSLGVKEIEEALRDKKLLVIDEIGKMELFSERFKEAVWKALDSENPVLGTIMAKKNPFADRVKKRNDIEVLEVKQENREGLVDILLKKLRS